MVERKQGLEKIIIENNGEIAFEEDLKEKKEAQIRAPIVLTEEENNLNILAYSTKKIKSYPRKIFLTYKEELLKGKTLPELVEYYFGKSRNWGVVIGINKYSPSKGFKPLPYKRCKGG